ncbi:alkaline phosphatase family protein [Intrasporangium mesophilum]
MSAPTEARKRPLSVTIVVALVVLAAVADVLYAVGSFGGRIIGLGATVEEDTSLPVVGWTFIALTVAQVVLALYLARGANWARLVVTAVLAARVAYAWVLVGEFDGGAGEGVVALVIAAVILYLLWSPAATAFFERRDEHAMGQALGRSEPGERSRVGAGILDFVIRVTVLGLTVVLTPGVSATSGLGLAIAVVAVALAGWLLRPVFVRIAGYFGWAGAIFLALFANAIVLGLAFYVTPGVEVSGVGSALLASWTYGAVMAAMTWLFAINSQDYLAVHAVRMSRGTQLTADDADDPMPGVVFVQLDGVPAPLLQNEIRAGNLPTISRWVRSGSHTWSEWVARVPSTTPVSQAGLLHGTNEGIPAFRWFDRDLGRLLVANRPEDATVIEARLSDGHGLLADDGVSISNLFSGDAQTSLLTMSGLKQKSTGLGPSASYAAFFTHPAGLVRGVVMSVGEMVKEVFQRRRQVLRDVQPRIHREGSYVALRAVTNVLLRDLNVALVVEAMMSGAKSIYVDFVDYDEIAHHAGVSRPESLASLYGLDEVLRALETVATSGATPRTYHFVLVSDHGQSQGSTFRQRYGKSLEELVREHLGGGTQVAAATDEVEAYGPVNVLLGQLSAQASVTGRLTKRALGSRDPENPLGPAEPEVDAAPPAKPAVPQSGPEEASAERPDLVVVGSGNLGGIWFAREPQRLQVDEIEDRHPGLLATLAAHPGIGFVVVMGPAGPVAIGRDGSIDLATGSVEGSDPLAGFGPNARADFDRAARFEDAPDIYVNSFYDPVLDEVAAFEELVGCHGGLGGWQTRPLLVHPADWPVDDDLLADDGRLHGADQVHRQLVRWLERLGHRAHLAAPADPSLEDPTMHEEVASS